MKNSENEENESKTESRVAMKTGRLTDGNKSPRSKRFFYFVFCLPSWVLLPRQCYHSVFAAILVVQRFLVRIRISIAFHRGRGVGAPTTASPVFSGSLSPCHWVWWQGIVSAKSNGTERSRRQYFMWILWNTVSSCSLSAFSSFFHYLSRIHPPPPPSLVVCRALRDRCYRGGG